MGRVVLDPGHGGALPLGASSSNCARGCAGLLEKHLVLDVAQRASNALVELGHHVVLTRNADYNLTLHDRAQRANEERADVFVSIHLNTSESPRDCGFEIWLHEADDSPATSALGNCTRNALARISREHRRGPVRGPLAVLDPRYRGNAAACLAELGYLSHPGEERLMGLNHHRSKVAHALARGIHEYLAEPRQGPGPSAPRCSHFEQREQFDVWHEVPLVPQWTGMSCWAAAAAMIVGWRDCIEVDPEAIVRGSGQWEAYHHGLDPADTETLRRAWGLTAESVLTLTVPALRQLLEERGPLWVGEASPGLHVVVVAGAWGDGSPGGTLVRVADPWPERLGERYTVSFADFARSFTAVGDLSGIRTCILHAGGRSVGRSRGSHMHQSYQANYWSETKNRPTSD